MRDVTILGAGLVGATLATLLAQKGHKVTVYERRSDMRKDSSLGGRSINLAMSTRGWKAMEYAGAKDLIQPIALPMKGRYLHQADGSKAFQAYGKNGEAIYSISRSELNKRLMSRAEDAGVQFIFNHRSLKVAIPQNIVTLQEPDGSKKTLPCDLLFGADGAFSSLRTSYTFQDRTNFQQFFIPSGYKELSMPAGPASKKWLIENDGLHIWPRHQFMMIALPNTDGSFTCTLFFPFEGELSFKSINNADHFLTFMEAQFPDAYPLMPHLAEDFNRNPISSLVTTKIQPWHYGNQSCLIGDAAHAVVPFYGQGMNAGLEDCTVLYDLMEQHGEDWETILTLYEQMRKPNGDAVADLSLMNFIEMRDKVADPVFLERKKIEKELGRLYPEQFNSIYEMVSFSHTPYSKALHDTKAQDELLEAIQQQEGDFFLKVKQADYKAWLDKKVEEYYVKVSLKH